MKISPGSYRDRHSGVVFDDDRVVRWFSDQGASWYRETEESGLIERLQGAGLLVPTETIASDPLQVVSPRIDPITYPYEWTASMLRDAGLLTLEVAAQAWDAGFHLRDASAFNVVFDGGRPRFVDLGSFRSGHSPFFEAYGQFCDHFLNPVALSCLTGVTHRLAWNTLEGADAVDIWRLLRWRLLRRGLVRNIWVRAHLEQKSQRMPGEARMRLRRDYGLPPEVIRRSFDSLKDALESLRPGLPGNWDRYEETNNYTSVEEQTKTLIVEQAAARFRGDLAVDIGANTGRYAVVLADHFRAVVALEQDEASVEIMYARLRQDRLPPNISPAVMDIVDPTPARGFGNLERASGLDRLRGADLMTWLAVFHHLVVTRNVPLGMLFSLLADLGPNHVVEHVSPRDPMSELLLSSREESPWPFDRSDFEREAKQRFTILESEPISETRTMYTLTAR